MTLLFPAGHYRGRYFAGPGGPLRYHAVRIGVDVQKLHDDDQFVVWGVAHGLPDRDPDLPWTRDDVVAATSDRVADPGRTLDDLVGRGLVVEVAPDLAGMRRFADAYRVEPLLVGLGNTPDAPGVFSLGVPGFAPIVGVDPVADELWRWGHGCADLWAACTLMAGVAASAGGTDPERTDPEAVLRLIVPALRTLVSHNAAYLDVVRPTA